MSGSSNDIRPDVQNVKPTIAGWKLCSFEQSEQCEPHYDYTFFEEISSWQPHSLELAARLLLLEVRAWR
jgi:hypothetical protein